MKNGTAVTDKDGAIIRDGRHSLHNFRHAAASLQVTFDTYGHPFAAVEDDSAVMAQLEAGMMGVPAADPEVLAGVSAPKLIKSANDAGATRMQRAAS